MRRIALTALLLLSVVAPTPASAEDERAAATAIRAAVDGDQGGRRACRSAIRRIAREEAGERFTRLTILRLTRPVTHALVGPLEEVAEVQSLR